MLYAISAILAGSGLFWLLPTAFLYKQRTKTFRAALLIGGYALLVLGGTLAIFTYVNRHSATDIEKFIPSRYYEFGFATGMVLLIIAFLLAVVPQPRTPHEKSRAVDQSVVKASSAVKS